MRVHEFETSTPSEFKAIMNAYSDKQEMNSRFMLEMSRWIVFSNFATTWPKHYKKVYDVVKFSWEKAVEATRDWIQKGEFSERAKRAFANMPKVPRRLTGEKGRKVEKKSEFKKLFGDNINIQDKHTKEKL